MLVSDFYKKKRTITAKIEIFEVNHTFGSWRLVDDLSVSF